MPVARTPKQRKQGLCATASAHHLSLLTQEAAELLKISRPTRVRLHETRVIPFDKPNRLGKVRLVDLPEYRRQRRGADQALSDMVADSQRMVSYDADPAELIGNLVSRRRSVDGRNYLSPASWRASDWIYRAVGRC